MSQTVKTHIQIWQRLHIFTNEINTKNHLVHTMEKHTSFQ